jgi:DNA polymerase III subunit beta
VTKAKSATVTVAAGALRAACASVIGVVEGRNTIPILANLLIDADGSHLRVTGTDLDLWCTRQIPVDSGDVSSGLSAGGRPSAPRSPANAALVTTVHARSFAALVGKIASDAAVLLSLADGQLTVASGRLQAKLPTLPVDDFPVVPAPTDWSAQWEMAGAELAAMLEFVKPAISTEEARYYLNGVFLERSEAELLAVATDGHRLAIARRPAPDGTETLPLNLIVPRKLIGLLGDMLKEARVGVSVSDCRICIEAGEVTLTGKLIDGQFPVWRRVVPVQGAPMEVDRKALSEALGRVATIATDKTQAVKLAFDNDRLTLSVVSAENGSATEEVECDWSGPPLEIGFNARYLAEVLKGGASELVTAEFGDPAAPSLWGQRDGDAAVLMPMRV